MANDSRIAMCGELDDRGGTVFDGQGPRTYTRRFKVVVKVRGLSSAEICYGHTDIPRPYTPFVTKDGGYHDLDARMIRMSGKLENEDDWQNWIVTCEYSTNIPVTANTNNFPTPNTGSGTNPDGSTGNGDGGSPNSPNKGNNPEFEPPELDWDVEEFQYAPAYDLDGKAFLNSAGQPFSPAPTFPRARRILIYAMNQLKYSPDIAELYNYALNNDQWNGRPPGTVQCLPAKAKQVAKGGWTYWRVTYRIRFARMNSINEYEKLQPELLDAGMMEMREVPKQTVQLLIPVVGAANPQMTAVPVYRLMHITDGAGHPVSAPVCLDGKGRKQQPKSRWIKQFGAGVFNGKVVTAVEPVFLQFKEYVSQPFKRILQVGF